MTARRALLVGINDYPLAPLSGCVNDAIRLKELLSQNEDGSPNFDCRVFLSHSESITRASLKQRIQEVFAQEAEIALLYFSGHGVETNLGGYLVTPDATTYDEGVPMADVLTVAADAKVKAAIVILDCCQSGAFGQIAATGSHSAFVREGLSVLTASRSTESAFESNGAGIFTTLLCGALDGGAADVIGRVTLANAYAYIDQSLGAWDQRPMFKAHVSALPALRICKPAVPLEILRQLPRWFPSNVGELQLNPTYEPVAEPRGHENENVFAALQKCARAKLVEPVGAEHMYYAAMQSKSCRLTPLGRHYWRLANEGRI